jgi:hypothetical protein
VDSGVVIGVGRTGKGLDGWARKPPRAPIFFFLFHFARPEVTKGMCEKMQKCGVVKCRSIG